jgi:hypothetical protein
MIKIHLALEDTDLFNCIKSIIDHPNSAEIAKVLTYSIGFSTEASALFFKTYFGDIAPDILPVGTIVKIKAEDLGWGIDTAKMKADALLDANGNATVIITDFKGFSSEATYYVRYTELDSAGKPQEKTGFLNYKDIIEVVQDL